ncbi:MAG: 4-hydroxy-tetrahydrodipicolinate reductase [Oligoflexia bacterium]|nr:4-hydroxy-tetrahydrodipicolinate reductase [Oligoflexia bacterium]
MPRATPDLATIAIHGASGRLGKLIVQQAAQRFAGPILRDGPIPPCGAVVDVSSAQGTVALVARLDRQPLLVGTTGDLPIDLLERYAKRAPVAIVSNFSAGVPLLIDLVQGLMPRLPHGWQVEVVEAHHAAKKDAPSGTAKRLLTAIGRPDVPTHSLRIGDTVGEHRVILAGPGERLELTHIATRRDVFAIGALRHVDWLVRQAPGLYRP